MINPLLLALLCRCGGSSTASAFLQPPQPLVSLSRCLHDGRTSTTTTYHGRKKRTIRTNDASLSTKRFASTPTSFDTFDYNAHWYPVIWSQDVPINQPIRVTLFDVDYGFGSVEVARIIMIIIVTKKKKKLFMQLLINVHIRRWHYQKEGLQIVVLSSTFNVPITVSFSKECNTCSFVYMMICQCYSIYDNLLHIVCPFCFIHHSSNYTKKAGHLMEKLASAWKFPKLLLQRKIINYPLPTTQGMEQTKQHKEKEE